MLTKLRIENFKALKDIDLTLRQRNIFIGPNKSGKSSILQALQVLTHLMNAKDVTTGLGGELGFQQWLWKGSSDSEIRISIWGDDRPSDTDLERIEFRYSIHFGLVAMKSLCIINEFLAAKVQGYENEKVLVQSRMGTGTANRANGDILFQNPGTNVRPFLSYELPGWEGNQVRSYIAKWQFFDLVPELPKVTAATPSAQSFLEVQGSNLSSWLHTFQSNHPEEFRRIVAVAREAFPEIESITVPVSQSGTTFISTKEKGLRSPISLSHLSSGEIKFLQLLSIIFSPYPVSLVAIEEPENNLHPRLLQLLIETYDRVRIEVGDAAAQVFVTTHSPYLVDLMQPEDVVIVEKRDGATSCVRAEDKHDLKRMMEESEMSFGRLWYSGALGGV